MSLYHSRARKSWTITETISLQREYELLGLSLEEIADRHKRSVFAIISRLETEDYYTPGVIPNCSIIDSVTNTPLKMNTTEAMSDRMQSVETSLNEMREVVTQMMELMSHDLNRKDKPKSKRKPLRARK
jgi:hypothetical protein